MLVLDTWYIMLKNVESIITASVLKLKTRWMFFIEQLPTSKSSILLKTQNILKHLAFIPTMVSRAERDLQMVGFPWIS